MNKLYRMRLPNLFILLSICSCFLFVSIGWILSTSSHLFTSLTMRQTLSHMSGQTLMRVLEWEIPYLYSQHNQEVDREKPFSLFLFESLTTLKPSDLRSLMGRELPALSSFHVEILAAGRNIQLQNLTVIESPAPKEAITGSTTGENPAETQPSANVNAGSAQEISGGSGKQTILIYNTHNTESWSHVSSEETNYTHDKHNITLVSKRLAEELNKRGINTKVDETDHQQKLKEKGLPFALSYAQSLKSVQAAIKQDNSIGYLFDLHRDANPKDLTTAVIDGKSYARPYFVIGKKNHHWEKNAEFAKKIHRMLEDKYPGLSIGVLAKDSNQGNNGEYNQSLSPNSLLIEIGGIENTLEECYNTAAALAHVIADIYFEKDKKVDSPITPDNQPM